jgi:hypothetical protein
LRLSERGPLNVERLPGDLGRLLEPSVRLLGFFKVLPQKAVAFRGIVAVIPATELFDYDRGTGGHPLNEVPRRTQRLGEFVSQEHAAAELGGGVRAFHHPERAQPGFHVYRLPRLEDEDKEDEDRQQQRPPAVGTPRVAGPLAPLDIERALIVGYSGIR